MQKVQLWTERYLKEYIMFHYFSNYFNYEVQKVKLNNSQMK
jgi:hypothetical protein